MKRKRKPRFLQLLEILVIYVLLFAVVLSVGRNVLYSVRKSAVTILEKKDFRGTVKPEEAETLLIWERDDNGRNGREEMGAIFSQMRIPFAEKESKEFTEDDLQGMETVVLSVTDLGTLGTNLTKLLDWVYKGHSLLFLYPPYNEATF